MAWITCSRTSRSLSPSALTSAVIAFSSSATEVKPSAARSRTSAKGSLFMTSTSAFMTAGFSFGQPASANAAAARTCQSASFKAAWISGSTTTGSRKLPKTCAATVRTSTLASCNNLSTGDSERSVPQRFGSSALMISACTNSLVSLSTCSSKALSADLSLIPANVLAVKRRTVVRSSSSPTGFIGIDVKCDKRISAPAAVKRTDSSSSHIIGQMIFAPSDSPYSPINIANKIRTGPRWSRASSAITPSGCLAS